MLQLIPVALHNFKAALSDSGQFMAALVEPRASDLPALCSTLLQRHAAGRKLAELPRRC